MGDNNTVIDNFRTMFGENKTKGFMAYVNSGTDFYIIDKFRQYVVFIQHDRLGLSMRLSDFNNSIDAALDEYLLLMANGWEQANRDKYVRLVQEIKQSNVEQATMVVRPLTA